MGWQIPTKILFIKKSFSFLILFLLFMPYYSKSQNLLSNNCEIYKALVNSGVIKKFIGTYDFDKAERITIIDTNYYFKQCNIINNGGKKVILVVHDSTEIRQKRRYNLVLVSVKQKEDKYFVTLFYKRSKVFGTVTLIKARKKISVIKYQVGHF